MRFTLLCGKSFDENTFILGFNLGLSLFDRNSLDFKKHLQYYKDVTHVEILPDKKVLVNNLDGSLELFDPLNNLTLSQIQIDSSGFSQMQ